MFMVRVCHPRDHIPLVLSAINFRRVLQLTLLFFFLLMLLTPAVSATEYTARPSLNIGKVPGASVAGEEVKEIQPIPAWLAIVFLLFPHMTALPMEFLISLKGISYLGFKQINKKNTLNNLNRRLLYEYIGDNPGVYFREIERNCNLNRGTIEYHLRVMELLKIVTTNKSNNKKRYFTENSLSPEDITVISVIKNETKMKILSTIFFNLSASNKEISEKTLLSPSTVSRHLRDLKNNGLIVGKIDGRIIKYNISDNYYDTIFQYLSISSYFGQYDNLQQVPLLRADSGR